MVNLPSNSVTQPVLVAEGISKSYGATRALKRVLMTTAAPSFANASAIAKPMPWLDPLTRAVLSSSCKFIMVTDVVGTPLEGVLTG